MSMRLLNHIVLNTLAGKVTVTVCWVDLIMCIQGCNSALQAVITHWRQSEAIACVCLFGYAGIDSAKLVLVVLVVLLVLQNFLPLGDRAVVNLFSRIDPNHLLRQKSRWTA